LRCYPRISSPLALKIPKVFVLQPMKKSNNFLREDSKFIILGSPFAHDICALQPAPLGTWLAP
jgi:hypothetical protein